jgi:hypothetical protein
MTLTVKAKEKDMSARKKPQHRRRVTDQEKENVVRWERLLQTIFAGLITMLIAWIGNTTSNNVQQITQLSTNVVTMQGQMAGMISKVDNLYRSSDAARDLALRDSQISDLRDRVSDIEKQQRYGERNRLTPGR